MHALATIEAEARRNRWASRHPVEKVLAAGLALCLTLGHASPLGPLVMGGLALTCIVSAGVSVSTLAKVVVGPLLLLVGCACLLAVSVTWSPLGVHMPTQAVVHAFRVAGRGASALLVTLGLALTTPVPDLAWLLRRSRLPEGLVHLLLSMHRFLRAVERTIPVLVTAQRARLGYLGWTAKARSTGEVAAVLFGRTIERTLAEQRALALRGDPSALAGDFPAPSVPVLMGLTLVAAVTAFTLNHLG